MKKKCKIIDKKVFYEYIACMDVKKIRYLSYIVRFTHRTLDVSNLTLPTDQNNEPRNRMSVCIQLEFAFDLTLLKIMLFSTLRFGVALMHKL